MPKLLLGDEAVAQAAIDAGICGAFAYPGTPATEIFEYIEQHTLTSAAPISAIWSGNEKSAYEEALGMSFVGRRALVSMKHVGLNVAADPFMSSALTGVNGGLVLAVADDPGMHSSQNEQDSRHYADFAQLPLFEPANQQQAYEMTRAAFDLSETLNLPVMLRLVTRLAHSRAPVELAPPVSSQPHTQKKASSRDWVLLPINARRRFQHLVSLQPTLRDLSQQSPFNRLQLASQRGILCSGIARNYVAEILPPDHDFSLLEIGTYPLPLPMLREFASHCDQWTIIEDGYPLIERQVRGLLGLPNKQIYGKLTGELPSTGELSPDIIAAALHIPRSIPFEPTAELAPRPPQLCRGCPHNDTFNAINTVLAEFPDAILFGDIGCYTLGGMPTSIAMHSAVDMGASIAMALGAARAGQHPVLCVIGDSTFGHSGVTPLLNAALHNANITVLILDNATVAMTGTQSSLTSGDRLLNLLRGCGVPDPHLQLLNPLARHHETNVTLIRQAIAHHGLSVLIPARPCIHTTQR